MLGRLRPAAALAAALGLVALAAWPAAAATARPEQPSWHATQIRADRAHDAGYHGRGVVVAVLDGWVDARHADFAGRVKSAADCVGGTCRTKVTADGCGQHHGTHVAGTVTSSSYGVADLATLMPVRVLASDSSGECAGDPDDVAAGIRWAVAHGADVLNLSLGPDVPGLATSSAIPTAVREAAAKDVVVVFSAGNADLPVAQAYGQDALVVAATGPSGALASYSQHGQGVSVAAPGGEPTSSDVCSPRRCVTSLYAGNQYAVAAGTSMAAPHVAGLAALLRAAHPTWTGTQVRDRITATARPLDGAGAGLVDAAAALGVRSVKKASPRPSPTRKPVVRTGSSPRPRPVATATPRRTAAPVVIPTPAPTRATAPSTASPTPAPVLAEPPLVSTDEDVPVALAAVAGLLVGLAATGVLVLPRL